MAASRRVLYAAECVDPTVAVKRPYTFRLLNYADEYMEKQVEYLRKKNLKKIALLLTDNGYLHTMTEGLKRVLPPDFSLTLIDNLPATTMDLRTSISKIRSGNYDVVAVFLSVGQIAAFYRQARELHLEKPTFGTNWFESVNEIKNAHGAMDGAVLANNAIKPDFVERYSKQFGIATALNFGAPAYEFAMIVGEAVSTHSSHLTADEFLKQLSTLGTRPGVAIGPYTFLDHPKVGKYFKLPIVNKTIKGEVFVELPD
jgi:ABC-type branched-subunit amino acid transport system substrate-binding protein